MNRIWIALAVMTVLCGCSAGQVQQRLDAVGDKVESGLENMLDSTSGTQATAKPDISWEQAVSIALNHAETTEDKVSGLRTEYEVDDGVGHYDIRFILDGQEYDYEIDAKTGEILSFEKDE